MKDQRITGDLSERVREMTRYLVHKHYGENDVEAIVRLFDNPFSWIGASEEEYAVGTEKVAGIFRQFVGKVPKCNITHEQYDVMMVTPRVYLCTGRMWIATDPSTNTYLRVHQRITTLFREEESRLFCCHIHISNPYMEMVPGDIGFPTHMAQQSYEYLQECVLAQRKQIEEQTAELRSIYHTVPCAIIRVLRTKCGYKLLTFNQALGKILGRDEEELAQLDWSEGCCPQIVQEDLKKLQEALEKLKKPGDRADVMYRIRDTAGGVLHIQSSNLFINGNEKGQVIQRFAYDITERVRMEADLERKSYEDSMTGMFNRSRFNLEMERGAFERCEHLGVACLDINGLKAVNDRDGHRAGDDLIRRTANHIRRIFDGKAYRTGGDEFLILDDEREKPDFLADIDRVRTDMKEDGISISVGISWRRSPCSFQEQFDEADKRMYDEKKKFYSIQEHDRRKRGGKPSHLPASRNILR